MAHKLARIALATLLSGGLIGIAAPAEAAPAPPKFKNCAALNKKFKHGVAKKGAKDKVRGSTKPVTNFTVNTPVYNANKKLDGDKDGIACEKR